MTSTEATDPRDATGGIDGGGTPRLPGRVMRPETVDEVVAAVRCAKEAGAVVVVHTATPRIEALDDQVLTLMMDRLDRVEVDPDARVALVQAGVRWSSVLAAA